MYTLTHGLFLATDKVELPFLMYEPVMETNTVAIYLHGNGSSSVFYSPCKMQAFASELSEKRMAFFTFNNRGAHYIQKLVCGTDDIKQGTAFELIGDCIKDIDGAIEYLSKKGYQTIYLIGTSTGANKAVLYNSRNQGNTRVSKYVLLSAGDDTGLYYEMLGKDTFIKALHESRQKKEEGKGSELVPMYLSGGLISYQSLFDTINPDGEYNIFPYNEHKNKLKLSKKRLFGEWREMMKPTFVIYGSQDEYCYGDVPGCMEILKNMEAPDQSIDYKIIKGADHGFHGYEQILAKEVAHWLAS